MEPRALHGTRLEGPAGGGRSEPESLAPAAWPSVPAFRFRVQPLPPWAAGLVGRPCSRRLWSLTAAPARRRFENPKQTQTTKKVN